MGLNRCYNNNCSEYAYNDYIKGIRSDFVSTVSYKCMAVDKTYITLILGQTNTLISAILMVQMFSCCELGLSQY